MCRLSCLTACGILVPQPGIQPACPALEGGFLTTGPPGKSPGVYLKREKTKRCKQQVNCSGRWGSGEGLETSERCSPSFLSLVLEKNLGIWPGSSLRGHALRAGKREVFLVTGGGGIVQL